MNNFLGLGGEFVFICLAIGIVMGLAGFLKRTGGGSRRAGVRGPGAARLLVSPFLMPDLRSPEDRRLEATVREYERVQGLPEIPVKVEEVKEFTDEPNAFATGLGPTRRVILWDTLVDGGFSRPEVDFVLAHELAHHSRNHLWKLAGWFAVIALPLAFVIALATRRRGGMYAPQAVPVAIFVLVVLQLIVTPGQNAVVRNYEQEADWVGLQTTCEPGAARASLQRLARKSLPIPTRPDGRWRCSRTIRRSSSASRWPMRGRARASARAAGEWQPTPRPDSLLPAQHNPGGF